MITTEKLEKVARELAVEWGCSVDAAREIMRMTARDYVARKAVAK